MKKCFNLSFISFAIFLCVSCVSTPGQHIPSIQNAKTGDYSKSINYIEKNQNKLYGKKNRVLYNLDSGLLYHYNHDFSNSISRLSTAEKDIYTLYTKSISAEIASFIINDNVLEYSGEDYEDIYLNVFNSLNYFFEDKTEDALVETNRAINKIRTIMAKYEPELQKARKAAEMKETKIDSIAFHDSALVEYLSMLYRRQLGDFDGAFTNQRMINDAFLTQKKLYNFACPSSIQEELSVPKNMARLNVVSFTGLSPIKDEIIIRDYGYANYTFALALPELIRSEYPFSKIIITAKNSATGKTVSQPLELLESMENVATETFILHRSVIYAKAIARSISKAIGSTLGDAVGQKLSESDDSDLQAAGLILQFFSLAGRITNQIIEHADMRISRYFPARASVCGITLEPGFYDIKIDYYDKAEKLSHSDVRQNFELKSENLNLIESVKLGK